MLRATQYLPDIVRLQQCLYDAFHHRLDKTDAMRQTVREFLNKQTSGNDNTAWFSEIFWFHFLHYTMFTENARNEYQERIGSLQKAWGLVGHMLKNHGKMFISVGI